MTMRLLLSAVVAAALLVPVHSAPADGPVPGRVVSVALDGSGTYREIQEAIDHSLPGDTILIKAGNYREDVVVVHGTHGFPLDEIKADRLDTVSRIGIDATVDPAHSGRFERRTIPGYDEIDLAEYLAG